MDWRLGSSGRALLCKWEAWSSNPNTAKKKRKEKKRTHVISSKIHHKFLGTKILMGSRVNEELWHTVNPFLQ
jgi:hypothetical protein